MFQYLYKIVVNKIVNVLKTMSYMCIRTRTCVTFKITRCQQGTTRHLITPHSQSLLINLAIHPCTLASLCSLQTSTHLCCFGDYACLLHWQIRLRGVSTQASSWRLLA